MNINLQIEELVLHGFASTERYRIADALNKNLAGCLANIHRLTLADSERACFQV
jgi:hypothetical protein